MLHCSSCGCSVENAGGTPGTLAQSFNVGSNVSRVNSGVALSVGATTADVFSYSAPINFTFTGGNTFYISILNNTLGDLDTFAVGAVQGPGEMRWLISISLAISYPWPAVPRLTFN